MNARKENQTANVVNDLKDIQYIQQILEYSLDMICTTDARGRFVSISKAVESILGYTVSEMVDLEMRWARSHVLADRNMMPSPNFFFFPVFAK